MLICWCEKTMGNGVKNDGQRRKKRRATKFIRMGNEIYNHGQRNSFEWRRHANIKCINRKRTPNLIDVLLIKCNNVVTSWNSDIS